MGTPIANPMSGYGGYKQNRTLWGIDAVGTVICKVSVQGGWSRCRKGNGEKLSNSQVCCLAQLCLAAA